MGRPSIEDLQNPDLFVTLAVLSHQEIIPFVQQALREHSLVTTGYWVATLLTLVVAFLSWLGTPFWEGLGLFGYGIILAYLLIILHENIHGMAYRMLGAKDVRIVYRWRQLTAYCVAHEFTLGQPGFWFVALAPFVIITMGILLLFVLLPQYALVWSGMLFMHTAACSGDVALVSYFWRRRDQSIYTYDDADQGKSYFVGKSA